MAQQTRSSELIKHAVKKEITRKTVEEKDLESRKWNIILYRVPEKKTESQIGNRMT